MRKHERTAGLLRDLGLPLSLRGNGHEHLLDALDAGAPWQVGYVPFFLNQTHVAEGATPSWEDPAHQPDLLSLTAGVVVRDRYPDVFRSVHRSLFAARHDDAGDLRDPDVVRRALERGGADPDAVLAEVESGWPAKAAREEHERAVEHFAVFGVPTFVVGERAAFVRLMTRPGGDGALARATIERVLGLVVDHPEINELKHTRIAR